MNTKMRPLLTDCPLDDVTIGRSALPQSAEIPPKGRRGRRYFGGHVAHGAWNTFSVAADHRCPLPAEMSRPSLVSPYGYSASTCGYCAPSGSRSTGETSLKYGCEFGCTSGHSRARVRE
jgi:arginine-tRNA-protein transferase